MKTDQTRRSFFATMALGISASAFPMLVNDFDDLANLAEFDSNELKDAEAWFKKIKGKHRIAYDGSSPHGGLPVIWNWAFYLSNNETGSPDNDITAMTVLRHSGIVFAFDSTRWEKYKLGEHWGQDPKQENLVYAITSMNHKRRHALRWDRWHQKDARTRRTILCL